MAKQFTLGKNERLKSRKLIEQLFHKGKSFSVFPLKIFYTLTDGEYALQFGVGVSNKNFKKAADRNRIKRLVRESYRLQKMSVQEKLKLQNRRMSVFFIYAGKELPGFDLLKQKVAVALKRLLSICDENNITNP